MDIAAYVPKWIWRLLLEERGTNVTQIRDK